MPNGNAFLAVYHSSLCSGDSSVCSPGTLKYHFAISFLFAKLKIIILMLILSSRVKGFFFSPCASLCSSDELGGGVFKMKIALNSLTPKLGSKWSETYFKLRNPSHFHHLPLLPPAHPQKSQTPQTNNSQKKHTSKQNPSQQTQKV